MAALVQPGASARAAANDEEGQKGKIMSDKGLTATDLLALTAQIVSAHVGNNAIAPADVPTLISAVHDALAESSGAVPAEEPRPTPAVPIKRSVQPAHLVCLEDGKKLKMLKRHLLTSHGMTPDEYRQKWGLSPDYPMVAPNYAQQRSELAKKIGLGNRAKAKPEATTPKPKPKASTTRRRKAATAA